MYYEEDIVLKAGLEDARSVEVPALKKKAAKLEARLKRFRAP